MTAIQDRIDLHIEVPALQFLGRSTGRTGQASAVTRKRVVAARQRQTERFVNRSEITCNARLGRKELKHFCGPDDSAKGMLHMQGRYGLLDPPAASDQLR